MSIPVPRKITVIMHRFWNNLPDTIRRNGLLNKSIIMFFIGPWSDLEWKKKYKNLSETEWEKSYNILHKHAFRNEDLTLNQKKEILQNITGKKVLEVGCGTGNLSILLAKKGFEVTALDCSGFVLEKAKNNAVKGDADVTFKKGFAESLPFAQSQFETVICCHTLEHVKDLEKSIEELKRVCKKRIILIVPRQKYNEYTPDLHTHFFEDKQKLIGKIGINKYRSYYVDCDIFYCGDIDKSGF